MHEATLVENILKIALAAARDFQSAHPDLPEPRIKTITCESGLLSCVEEHTLKACLEIFAEGTPAAGASLKLRTAPLACKCADCGHEFSLCQCHFICPDCSGDNIRFSGGRGFTIQSIDVDCGENEE
ncbi:MAG: hydrogenase maturation nickel metallochaperone HypA [Desulfovibrio sp.]|nr:hydrogenase maturation nickel metallochaperone HypA [Desulfovibrio sp.]